MRGGGEPELQPEIRGVLVTIEPEEIEMAGGRQAALEVPAVLRQFGLIEARHLARRCRALIGDGLPVLEIALARLKYDLLRAGIEWRIARAGRRRREHAPRRQEQQGDRAEGGVSPHGRPSRSAPGGQRGRRPGRAPRPTTNTARIHE